VRDVIHADDEKEQVMTLDAGFKAGQFGHGGADPRAAGSKGAAERERRRLERLGDAREVLEHRAEEVARRLCAVALAEFEASHTQVVAMRDVLDRTLGKVPEVQEKASAPSLHFMELIAELDASVK
jgi:hypothetical protein